MQLIEIGFFFLACHFVLLEVFKKKLQEEFPVEYKEIGSPQYGDISSEGNQKNFFKGDNPKLAQFLRNREFAKKGDPILTLIGYFILVSKALMYITLAGLLITLIVP
jgi:hypothetical protein